jgi:hypothetical protein
MPALGLTEPARADDIAVRGLVVAEGGRLVMISRRSFAAALELLSFLVKLSRMNMSQGSETEKGWKFSKAFLLSEISDDSDELRC